MHEIRLVGLVEFDHVNYSKFSMTLEFPFCSFKCDRENGTQVCQNWFLAKANVNSYSIESIIDLYLKNPLTKSIVMQGLEPLDSFDELFDFISLFRKRSNDDIVIYTGFYPNEIDDKVKLLKKFNNIIIKYGRYIPNQEGHYDEVLGVSLSSNNQFAEKIC